MKEACNDKKCYKHGSVRVRGGRAQGLIVSAKAKNTVIIERPLTQFFSKYKRWARRRSHIVAHNPACIGAQVGDMVTVGETRKLSRTKAWTVISVVDKTEGKK